MAKDYLDNKKFEIVIQQYQSLQRNKLKCELLLRDLKESAIHNKPAAINLKAMRKEYRLVLSQFENSKRDLATAFYLLSENIARYAKFALVDPDDAIQEGVMVCFEKVDRFDSTKGKAFNYLTTVVLNHLRQLYRTSRNYNEFKRKYQGFLVSQEPTYPNKRQKLKK